jgi:hypothetical protein
MSNTTSVEVNTGPKGCAGCLITILAIMGIWALLFGVNINGKHYGLSCGTNGVDIDTPAPKKTTP